MDIVNFFVACIGIFSLIQFLWIPSVERRLNADRSIASIKTYATLSVLGVLRGILLIASLTTISIIILLWMLQGTDTTTVEQISRTISTAKFWRTWLVGFGSVWGIIVTLSLTIISALYAHRRGKVRMVNAFQRVLEDELQQLEAGYEEGTLEHLIPTKEMMQIENELRKIDQKLAELGESDEIDEAAIAAQSGYLSNGSAQLKTILKALDIQRRVEVRLDQEEVELPKPTSFLERIQTFFISRGLLHSFNFGSRLAYIATLLLLVPSLLGLHSGQVDASVGKRIVELETVYVQLAQAELDSELQDELANLGEPAHELSDEDNSILEDIADTFENSIAESFLSAIDTSVRFTLRSNIVRDRVLIRAAEYADAPVERLVSGSGRLEDVQRGLYEVAENTLSNRRPSSHIADELTSGLQDAAQRSPVFMDGLRSQWANFQRPANSGDISRALFNHVTGTIFDGAGSDEIGDFVQRTLAGFDIPRESVQAMYKGQTSRLLLELIAGGNIEKGLHSIRPPPDVFDELSQNMRTVFRELPLDQANNVLRYYPPSLEAIPEKHVDLKAAIKEIDKLYDIRNIPRASRLTEAFEAVGGFRNLFPSQIDADLDTALARAFPDEFAGAVIDGIGGIGIGGPGSGGSGGSRPSGGGSGGGSSGVGSSSSRSGRTSPFALSRSLKGLRGSFRIGGVLIGEQASSESLLDFVDLQWEENDTQVRFTLIDAEGNRHQTIWHNKAIAYHALNYAADGRPIAVTMISAVPMQELKIHLHPTLVDTPLGVRIIDLDRFVDMYTAQDRLRNEAQDAITSQNRLYQFAWNVRVLAMLDELENLSSNLPPEMIGFKNQIESQVSDLDARKTLEEILMNSGDLADPGYSPLTVKTEFYDQTLVDLIIRLQSSKTVEQFENQLRSALRSELKDIDDDLFERWLSPPPEYAVLSGVREMSFEAAPAQFLMGADTESVLPLHFMLQVAFTTAPQFLPLGEDVNTYTDTSPWEFPNLKQHLEKTTLTGVADDERSSTILADSIEFTYLQRMFRLALEGHLGMNFPVEKLLPLVEVLETDLSKEPVRTLRWNVHSEASLRMQLELQLTFSGLSETEIEEYIDQFMQIRTELGIPVDEAQMLQEQDSELPSLN